MSALTILLVGVSLAYSGLLFLLGLYARRRVRVALRSAPPILDDDLLPEVVVVVAARDEEAYISQCIAALQAQDYPSEKLTILVAEDHSTDGTRRVVQNEIDRWHEIAGAKHVRMVYVPEPAGNLRSKANALNAGIEASQQPIILITDADCRPPAGWARAMAERFQAAPTAGIISGQTVVVGERIRDEVQAIDWTYLLTGAGALAELGLPVTAMGNNMGVRRAAYEAVGGYAHVPYSATEDYALFQAVNRKSNFSVHLPLDPALESATLPLDSLWGVYDQRRRWAVGGARAPLWVYAIYMLLSGGHIAPLVMLFFNPAWGGVLIALKMLSDVHFVESGPVGLRGRWRAIPAFQIFLFAYAATLPLAVAIRAPVLWKGRRL